MSLPPLKDLQPQTDVKGGSPKTPFPGMPVRDYQEYSQDLSNGTIWKMATSLLAGLFIMSIIAYFTALQNKGVQRKDMEEYVTGFFKDKEQVISLHNSAQDTDIGKLLGGEERITLHLNSIDLKLSNDEKDISDLQAKVRQFGDYVEEVRKGKR